jgi:hypothetical protein
MKRLLWVAALAACLVVGAAAEAHGPHARWGGSVWVGSGYWGGAGPWWGARPWWGGYYPGYYAAPPVVVQQPAPVYIQPTPAPEPQYWYYCEDTRAYYPYVKQCPRGWMRVVPPEPPAGQP